MTISPATALGHLPLEVVAQVKAMACELPARRDRPLVQAYSSSRTFPWTAATGGNYGVCVWARSSGSSADWEAFDCKGFHVMQ